MLHRGDSFLHIAFKLSINDAATLLSVSLLGLAIGAIFINFLSSRFGMNTVVLMACAVLGALSSLGFIYLKAPGYGELLCLLFFFGIVSSALMIPFTISAEINPSNLTATMSGFINFFNMLAGGVGQLLTGTAIQYFKHRYSTLLAYKVSLSIIPILFVLAIVVIILLHLHLKRHNPALLE